MQKLISTSLLLVTIVFPFSAFAAWTATDNFDFLPFGTGGRNWTSDWNYTPGVVAQGSDSQDGSVAMYFYGVSTAQRSFAPISSGILHFKFSTTDALQGHQVGIFIGDSANTGGSSNTNRAGIYLNNTGDGSLDVSDGQTYQSNLTTYNFTTWTTVDIKFDSRLGNVFQVSMNGGPFSADFVSGGPMTHIDQIVIDDQDTQSGALFTLSDVGPASITGSGDQNRLAKFVDSSIISNALFSDDGINTTLTSGNLYVQPNFLLDTLTNGILNIGSTSASVINIGHTGATTSIAGIFTAGVTAVGSLTFSSARTASNCSSSTSPASCGSAPSGNVAMSTGVSTLVVNTTAITASSQILITEDSSLGARLGITCNTGTNRNYSVSARTAGTSFTIKSSANPTGNKACLNYWIIN